uniref:Uncharacterized protein n=1 Tax=viral metagenome TaxID=1070528 RepID=A0A6C0LE36_9ZZZZ
MYKIKIYVITLKNKEDYIKTENYKNLAKVTNKIILSKGVLLNKEQSDKYLLYAKSAIGISLAHINVWKKIRKNNVSKIEASESKGEAPKSDFSIILEDDTLLNIDNSKFNNQINKIINNYDFDIYKIHSDFNNGFTSMAAYIINNKSIDKIINNHKITLGHLDFDLYILKLLNKIKVLTHKENLFITDENESTNRKDNYNILRLLDNIKLSDRCDKNLRHFLTFKVFRIFNYETIVFELLLFVLLIISIILKLKYLFFIIIILLIL